MPCTFKCTCWKGWCSGMKSMELLPLKGAAGKTSATADKCSSTWMSWVSSFWAIRCWRITPARVNTQVLCSCTFVTYKLLELYFHQCTVKTFALYPVYFYRWAHWCGVLVYPNQQGIIRKTLRWILTLQMGFKRKTWRVIWMGMKGSRTLMSPLSLWTSPAIPCSPFASKQQPCCLLLCYPRSRI